MDALDRELASALAVDPSPEFVARVRARVAREPEPRSWQMPRLVVATGAAVVVLATAVVLTPWPTPTEMVQAFRLRQGYGGLAEASAEAVRPAVESPANVGTRPEAAESPVVVRQPAAIQLVSIDDLPSADAGVAVAGPVGTLVPQMALNVEMLTGVHQ